jgi:serine/threonine protein kinase
MTNDKIENLAQSRTFKLAQGGLKAPEEDSPQAAFKQTMKPDTIVDGKYKIISLLGAGGMGAVYKASHLELNKEVALKTFVSSQVSMDAWLRFQREAQAIAKLDDANIVKVFDFGIGQNNLPYYTMELLNGQSLADKLLHDRPLPREQAIHYFQSVGRGLLHAHRLKMVHRDIKPANIFICKAVGNAPETIKLVDFGITKLMTDKGLELDSQRLTSTGLVFGSPLYMSPEQSLGLSVDERSDIYSFGCSLYEALTGQPPFVGENAFSTMLMHQQTKAPTLKEKYPKGHFEQRMESFIARSLAKDPDARHQSFEEVLQALQLIAQPTPAQPPGAPPMVTNKFSSAAPASVENNTDKITVEVKSEEAGSTGSRFNFKWLAWPLGLVLLIGTASLVSLAILSPKKPISALKAETEHNKSSAVTFLPALPSATESVVASDGSPTFIPTAPYYQGMDKRGNRVFNFPTKDNLGEIGQIDMPKGHGQQAIGRKIFPSGISLFLDTSPEVANNYHLLLGLRPEDLAGIGCDHGYGYGWTLNHFKEVGKLTHLKKIKISASALDGECFDQLAKLNQLTDLEIPDCPVKAQDVFKIKRLPVLQVLNLDATGDMTTVVDAIKNSSTITDLSLANCQLTDRELEKISHIKHIIHLKVGQNKISTAGLKCLLKLSALSSLDLEGAVLGPDCIPTLRAMKLTHLRLNAKAWSVDKQQQLKSFPNCVVKISGGSLHEILD